MSDTANLPLAILFALLFTLTLNLSKGIQKYGIAGLSIELIKNWKEHPELRRNFIFWTVGSTGTAVASVFQILAQPYAPSSSFVPAFSGIGLMALVLFSYFILKENIRWPEIIGSIVIVIATLLFGLAADEKPTGSIDYGLLGLIFLIPFLVLIIAALWSRSNQRKGHAIIWGAMAGFFSGFSIALSHTAAIEGERNLWSMLLTINLLLSIVNAQGAFWFTQYGFKYGHASIVVTFYSTFSLIFPILIDIIALDYAIPPFQLLMLALIGVGVILLTAFRKDADIEKKTE
jgi:drug/metabolite transporter (DMT)-like permease